MIVCSTLYCTCDLKSISIFYNSHRLSCANHCNCISFARVNIHVYNSRRSAIHGCAYEMSYNGLTVDGEISDTHGGV